MRARRLQHVGVHTLQEVAEDPLLNGRGPAHALQVLAHRLASQGWNALESYPQDETIHETEEGPEALLRHGEQQSSESEAGPQSPVRRHSSESRSRTVQYVKESIKIIKYVQYRAREKTFVCLIAFLALKEEQQSGATGRTSAGGRPRCNRRCSTNGRPAARPAASAIPPVISSGSSRKRSRASSMPGPVSRSMHRPLFQPSVSGIAARAERDWSPPAIDHEAAQQHLDPPARSVQGVLKPAGYNQWYSATACLPAPANRWRRDAARCPDSLPASQVFIRTTQQTDIKRERGHKFRCAPKGRSMGRHQHRKALSLAQADFLFHNISNIY